MNKALGFFVIYQLNANAVGNVRIDLLISTFAR